MFITTFIKAYGLLCSDVRKHGQTISSDDINTANYRDVSMDYPCRYSGIIQSRTTIGPAAKRHLNVAPIMVRFYIPSVVNQRF